MATAQVQLTVEQWQERALELARQYHLDGTASFLGTYTAGDGSHPVCWHVPSRDRTGRYTVEYDQRTGAISCHCVASTCGRPCCHAGAVVHALRQRAAATQPLTQAQLTREDLWNDYWAAFDAPGWSYAQEGW
jgi:hypothetical protein